MNASVITLANGFLFGIGLVLASAVMHALFHLGMC